MDELTDEQIQELVALGIIPEQQDLLQDQILEAQALRDYRPEMRGNGRVTVAAHPLEFLVQGIQGYKANKDIKEMRRRQEELLGKQATGRKSMYDAIYGSRGMRTPGINPNADMSMYGNDPYRDLGMF